MGDRAATILWDGRYSVNNAPDDNFLQTNELLQAVIAQTA